jgi:hypothetical protein
MQIFLRILKEIGIAILLLGILFAVGMLLFKNQIPFLSSDIPNPVSYDGINMADYDIKGDLEDETDPTRTYTASNNSLRNMEREYLIMTGSANPFTSQGKAEQDIPSEYVTIENKANSNYTETTTETNETENVTAPASSEGGEVVREL